MSEIPRRRKPPLARTRGTLRIYRNGRLVEQVSKGRATRDAQQARDAGYGTAGRQAFD